MIDLGETRRRELFKLAGAGALGATSLGLVACGDDEESGAAPSGSETEDVRIEYPQSGAGGIDFLKVVENGARQAAEDLGVELNVRASDKFDPVEQGRLVRSAAAGRPDGIITGVWDKDAIGKPVEEAVDKGVPVIVINAGSEFARDLGALAFIGQEEADVGAEIGRRLSEAGARNALVVNHQPGAAPVEERAAGFEEGFEGSSEVLPVDGTDPTATENRIRSAVRNGDYDSLFALGRESSEPAVRALDSLGQLGEIKMVCADYSPMILDALAKEQILFASDQQQWLQGYYGVQILTHLKRYGFRPAGDIPTGPSFVTPDSASQVVELSEQGIR
jgi:simple sugar transport system substrate-binding protein